MTYGLDRGLFIENGPANRAAAVAAERNFSRFGTWRKLDPERRLALIDEALNAPANDLIDQFPIAL